MGDPGKAREFLEWRHTIKFADIIREMIDLDIQSIKT